MNKLLALIIASTAVSLSAAVYNVWSANEALQRIESLLDVEVVQARQALNLSTWCTTSDMA